MARRRTRMLALTAVSMLMLVQVIRCDGGEGNHGNQDQGDDDGGNRKHNEAAKNKRHDGGNNDSSDKDDDRDDRKRDGGKSNGDKSGSSESSEGDKPRSRNACVGPTEKCVAGQTCCAVAQWPGGPCGPSGFCTALTSGSKCTNGAECWSTSCLTGFCDLGLTGAFCSSALTGAFECFNQVCIVPAGAVTGTCA